MTIGFGEPFGSGQPIAEMSDSATAPAFSSFEELRAVIETEPTIVSTALLIQAVQSRLQRGDLTGGLTDAELVKLWNEGKQQGYGHLAGGDATEFELLAWARTQRDQHAYLKRALAVLEGRLADAASAVNRESWRARLGRLTPDDPVPSPVEPPAVADLGDELPDAFKALFSDAAAFERELAPHVGGDSAEPMRGMLGAALSMLVQHYDVEPRALADYVRVVLRFTYPEAFK